VTVRADPVRRAGVQGAAEHDRRGSGAQRVQRANPRSEVVR